MRTATKTEADSLHFTRTVVPKARGGKSKKGKEKPGQYLTAGDEDVEMTFQEYEGYKEEVRCGDSDHLDTSDNTATGAQFKAMAVHGISCHRQ